MRHHYHAAWLVPIAERPIRDGWVTVDNGRIVSLSRRRPDVAGSAIDLGDVAILPGLVNAHTHLELSYLRGQVPPAGQFVEWIRGVIDVRRTRPDPASPEILGALDEAIAEAHAFGTAVVGDISNTLVTFEPLARSPLAAVVFSELIRFQGTDAEGYVDQAIRAIDALQVTGRTRASLAAHAPYSVGPAIFRAIRQAVDRRPTNVCSVHLAESAEEVEFIRTGSGPWRALLERLGAWDPAWTAPGVSPVRFLDDAGFLDSRTLAVHGVQMTSDDLRRLAGRGTTLVTCPRSNLHTGAGAPPVDAFYGAGVRVAIGTDSLASTPDLSIFAELAALRELAPSVPASALLDSATRQGSRALGFDKDLGTIEAGKLARLIAVHAPAGTRDVEEYLVSGIAQEQITWVERESEPA